jgi:hypothetical protein
MKPLLPATLALVAVFAVPFVSLADTYQYVNTQGALELVNADTAADALAIPTDRDPHSGVMLVTPTTPIITTTTTVVPNMTNVPGTIIVPTQPNTVPSASNVTPSSTMTGSAPVMWTVPGTYTETASMLGPNVSSAASTTAVYTLVLAPGTATLTTQPTSGSPGVVESGTWTETQPNEIVVNLNIKNGQTFNPSDMFTFSLDGSGMTAIQYNSSTYPDGLNLIRQPQN